MFTKSMARNIFYGGSMFFFLLFLALTFDTMGEIPKRDNHENLTEEVARGKMLWEVNDCIGCHTLMGEGAYFAPELANVYTRFGGAQRQLKDSSRVVQLAAFLVVVVCLNSILVIQSWRRLHSS